MTLAFNSQIWRMGYYFDDWEAVYLQQQLFSARQIWNYFLIDRPLISVPDILLNPIMGTRPLAWRILGQFLAWAAILILVKMLLLIWPKRIMEIGWIGLLLTVYPGISTLVVSRTYFRVYISLLLFSISLLLMVLSVVQSRHKLLYTSIAVLLGIIQVLITEYYAAWNGYAFYNLLYCSSKNSKPDGDNTKTMRLASLKQASPFFCFTVCNSTCLANGWISTDKRPILLTQLWSNPLNTILKFLKRSAMLLMQCFISGPNRLFQGSGSNAKSTLLVGDGFWGAIFGANVVEIWHRKMVKG